MKKKITVLLTLIMCLLMMSGCSMIGRLKEKLISSLYEPEVTVDEPQMPPEPEATAMPTEEPEPEPEPELPKIVFDDMRYIISAGQVDRIEADGSLTKIYECEDKADMIIYGGSGDEYYFIMESRSNKNDRIIWIDKDLKVSYHELPKDRPYWYGFSVYEDKLYYTEYDQDYNRMIMCFDPKTERETEDRALSELTNSFYADNRNLIAFPSGTIEQLKRFDEITVFDGDKKRMIFFDRDGNETGSFDTEIYSFDIKRFGDRIFAGYSEKLTEDGNDYRYYLTVFDRNTGDSNILDEYEDSLSEPNIITVRDDILYYTKSRTNRYDEQEGIDIYRMDLSDGRYAEEYLFGCSYAEGSQGAAGYYDLDREKEFGITDDAIYAVDYNGKGDYEWRKVPFSDMGRASAGEFTGDKVMHLEYTDYGKVTVDHDIKKDDTGFVYFKGHYDRFTFNSDIDNADLMNKTLSGYDKNFTDYGNDLCKSAKDEVLSEDSVEWFKDYIGYGYSYDVHFQNVEKLGSHYYQVTYDDYSYMGGAHGMGYLFYILLDENTGEQVKLSDLYKGSEDDLKDIIARYTVEDWKTGDHVYYSDPADMDDTEAYNEFLEYANINMTIQFAKDGIYAVYEPYALGPYASGFIDVFIPYDELGFDLND